MLERAVAAHQKGNFTQAEKLYKKLVKNPRDYNANQLLGLLYSSQGKLDLAIKHMNASLKIEPNQANVCNNIANAYKKKGLLQKAFNYWSKGIRLNNKYVEAYLNYGYALFEDKRLDQALEQIEKVITLDKTNAKSYNLLGLIQKEKNNYLSAIESYGNSLRIQPNNSKVLHNLGVAYRLNGEPEKSLECFNKLDAEFKQHFEVIHNTANVLSDLGKLEEAIELYARTILLNPLFVDAHKNLNRLLWSTSQKELFLKSYEQVLQNGNKDKSIILAYSSSLLTAGQPQLAIEAIHKHLEKIQFCDIVYDLLAKAYRDMENYDHAIRNHKNVKLFNPENIEPTINYGITLLLKNDISEAISIFEKSHDLNPANMLSLAYLSCCYQITNNDKSKRLKNYDALIYEEIITAPDNFDSLEAFNSDLNNYLTSLHTSSHQPLEQTLRNGTQTEGNFFQRKHPLAISLENQIKKAIACYIESLNEQSIPFTEFPLSQNFKISDSWSVRLKSSGYHSNHMHPMGWISGVYYVDIPDFTDSNKNGWLKIGEPNIDIETEMLSKQYVEPIPGKVVLFPSYVWHGTVPFESSQDRTTIAFDITPC